MNDNHHSPGFELPVPPVVGLAALACLASLALIFWMTGPGVFLVESGWTKLGTYVPVPLLVTFLVLYHGNWRRENSGAARVPSLLMTTGFIFALVLLVIVAAVCVVGFYALSLPAGMGGR